MDERCDRWFVVTFLQDSWMLQFIGKTHNGRNHVFCQTFRPDYSGPHGAGLLAVLTCSGGAQEHVIELHLWNSRFAPVSSPVMTLHCETFDTMFTSTARREVSHPVGRPSVVVRGDRDILCANLSSWFIGNFSREWAESQCRLCILGIVDPYPMDPITSRDFDLQLT